MKNEIDNLISSLNIPVLRDFQVEEKWNEGMYSEEIKEAVSFYCKNATLSDHFEKQLSQIFHQGYLVVNEQTISVPRRSIFEAMELVCNGCKGRGLLRNISQSVGFDVSHIHFGQSSFIVENWRNYAKKSKLANKAITQEVLYENLISSVEKPNKTGEWLVYCTNKEQINFLAIWCHKADDSNLISIINKAHA